MAALSFDHRGTEHKPGTGKGRDADNRMYHKGCSGRWVGEIYIDGKRVAKVSAQTKGACETKAKAKREELERGVTTSATYTVAMAVEDWLRDGLDGRDLSTVKNAAFVLGPVVQIIGVTKPLSKLTGEEALEALRKYAKTRSYSTVKRAHVSLTRTIKYAMLRRKVSENVCELFETPPGGSEGRARKAFTLHQVAGILLTAQGVWNMDLYVHLGILHGDRPEELRALRWENLDAEGYDVVTSVRRKGRLKTETSKRGHVLAELARAAVARHRKLQDQDRENAAELWHETGVVFADRLGRGPMTHGYMRKLFREMLAEVPEEYGIDPEEWVPYELRHTFASLMSEHGEQTVDVIAKEMGHRRLATTQGTYIHALKPRRTGGAGVMDRVLRDASKAS